jgi:hypothetical protein
VAFGHKNAPQYFAPVVRALLDPCIRAKQCVCYFEDVAGGGETFDEMLASLSAVLTLLAAHDVRINLSKCMFGFSELVYTGFAVSAQGHRLASSRLDPILNYPSNPQTLSQCRRLNGLIIQLSSYIANFSLISKPIQDCITAKPFRWTAEATAAFAKIKVAILNSDILHHVDYSLPLVVRTDASDKGVGAVLYQVDPVTGKERFIVFLSHIFSKVASRWPTVEQEAFALYWAVILKLRHLLAGHPFLAEIDHANLRFFWFGSLLPLSVRTGGVFWRKRT